MPDLLLAVADGTPLFDIQGILGKFISDYTATLKDAGPIILVACLGAIGLTKGIGLVKKLANKVG